MNKLSSFSVIWLTVAAVFLSMSTAVAQDKKFTKELCLTFDELPASREFGDVDVKGIDSMILKTLKEHKIKAAGFVVGSYIEESFDILGEWLNNGHTLGSMTYSNQDFHQIDLQSFTKDIAMGAQALEPMLAGFGQKKRYFRFPYLHYGTKFEDKDAAMIFLEDRNIVVAHATILVDDYLYNLTLEKMGKSPDSFRIEQLRDEYLEHLEAELEAAEYKAKDVLGKNCRQILQLRANRLNAFFLEDIIALIESFEYKFVTLDRALKDPLYVKAEAYFGALGVGYLDMILLSDPDILPAE